MDPELRFKAHTLTQNNTVINYFHRLKIVYNIHDYLSMLLRKQLVDILVLSKLNYCDVVYYHRSLARRK